MKRISSAVLFWLLFFSALIFAQPTNWQALTPRIPGLDARRLAHLQQEWQVQEVEPNILKMTHKETGMVKYVDITDHPMDFSKLSPNVQVVDLINADTTLYNWKYLRKNMIPVGGFGGYPLVISDLNSNNLIDIAGFYQIEISANLAKATIFELQTDSNFILQKVYADTQAIPLAVTDVDGDSLRELNIRGAHYFSNHTPIDFFNNYESSQPDSYPNKFNLSHNMWYSLGSVGSETFTDLDNDNITDVLYLGDDTIPQPCYEIFVAEYNPSQNNFERKFGMCSPGFYTSGFSVGDFDGDGFKEFDTGGLFADVFVFENTGDDSYQLIYGDTISAPNAYLNASTNDIDNNGKPEFFIGGSSYYNGIPASRIYWFEASGNNTYQKVRSIFLLGTDVLGTTELYAHDVNGDGIDDLVFSFSFSIVMLVWNDSTQQFDLFYYDYWENLDQEIQSASMYDVFDSGQLDLFVSVTDIAVSPYVKSFFYQNNTLTSIKDIHSVVISQFRLYQNFPNPFNNTTQIEFHLPQRLQISLMIYDITGKEVITLINNQHYAPGRHSIKWNGRTNNGKEVTSGLYFYVLKSGDNREVKKLLIIK
jgi:hypothetical protein